MEQRYKQRRGYELKFLFLDRPIRPFHLAVLISCAAVCISNLDGDGVVLIGLASYMIALASFTASSLLFFGWFLESDKLDQWGLLIAAGMWASRATFALLTHTGWFSVVLSCAWLVGTSGAYMLERYDTLARDDE